MNNNACSFNIFCSYVVHVHPLNLLLSFEYKNSANLVVPIGEVSCRHMQTQILLNE